MKSYINIFIYVNSFAAIHGIILSFILYAKKQNQSANRILALMVFAFSIGLIGSIYVSSGIYIKLWWLSPFFNSLPFSFGPLLYFYIKSLTIMQFRLNGKELLHFTPLGLSFILYSSVFFISKNALQNYFNNIYFQSSIFSIFSMVIIFIQIFIYILLCLKLFKNHALKIRKSYSYLGKVSLIWIRDLVILLIIMWLISVSLQSLLPYEFIKNRLDNAMSFFLLALFIFSIAYRGLSQPEIFDLQLHAIIEKKKIKYKKTGLQITDGVEIKEQLLLMMEKTKLYMDPLITLPQLAEKIKLPVHQLSQVINENIDSNFYRFINNYRVNEAKKLLKKKNTSNDKLIKIAFDSGFNSLSTFNRVFKDLSGITPSQFKKS